MKRLAGMCVLAGLTIALCGAVAHGSFSNPPLDGGGSGVSDFGDGQQEADDFALGAPSSIDQVRWWGSYGATPDPAPADDFLVRLYNDVAGAPAVNPFSEIAVNPTRAATALTASVFGGHDGGTVYEYVASLPAPVGLSGGTTYYLSIVNNTATSRWGWLEDGDGPHWWRSSEGSVWALSGRNTNFAFELSEVNIIPAPGALLLGALGTGLVGWMRRRRAM